MVKIITSLGSGLMARNITGEKIIFTSLKVGTGIAGEENPYNFSSLKNQVESTEINNFSLINEKIIEMEAIFSNENFETAQSITEYGIYAKIEGEEEEQLYCYICRPELPENIPAYSSDTLTKKIKRFRIEVGTAENVTVSVDETIVYVTHENLNLRLSQKADLSELQKIKDYLGLEDLQSALGYSYLGEFYLG